MLRLTQNAVVPDDDRLGVIIRCEDINQLVLGYVSRRSLDDRYPHWLTMERRIQIIEERLGRLFEIMKARYHRGAHELCLLNGRTCPFIEMQVEDLPE